MSVPNEVCHPRHGNENDQLRRCNPTLAGRVPSTRFEPLLEVLVDVSISTYTQPKLSKTSRVVEGGGVYVPVFFPWFRLVAYLLGRLDQAHHHLAIFPIDNCAILTPPRTTTTRSYELCAKLLLFAIRDTYYLFSKLLRRSTAGYNYYLLFANNILPTRNFIYGSRFPRAHRSVSGRRNG